MGLYISRQPLAKSRIVLGLRINSSLRCSIVDGLVSGFGEKALGAVDFFFGQGNGAGFDALPFSFNLLFKGVRPRAFTKILIRALYLLSRRPIWL